MSGEAHKRIDAGVKRGPRKPRNDQATASAENATAIARQGKLADLNFHDVLERYLNDETTGQIAASLNVHRSALNQWLLRHAEEPWKQAQVARAITALEEAKERLACSQDALSLARAREQLRGAQWELERVFHRIYGQKQEVSMTVDIHVQVDHALSSEAGQLLGKIRERVVAQTPKIIDVAPLPSTGAITPPKDAHS